MQDKPDSNKPVIRTKESNRERTLEIIKNRTTDIELWGAPVVKKENEGPLWFNRAEAAARIIPECKRILDIGCWDMKLEKFLPAGCTYIPMDVVARDERTIVVNLNESPLPAIDADFFVCLGVIEYIHNIPKLFHEISRQFSSGLISYYPMEKNPGTDRLAMAWVNSLNSPELIAIINAAGFTKVSVLEYTSNLHFYLLGKS